MTRRDLFEQWVSEQRRRCPWPHVRWADDVWDCDHGVAVRGRQQTAISLYNLASLKSPDKQPFREPFGDYVRGLLVAKAILAPTGGTQYRRLVAGLRYLEQALIAATGSANPWDLRVGHFMAAEKAIAESALAHATKWAYVRLLNEAAELSVAPLTTGVAEYRPAFKAPRFRRAVTREEQAADAAKMPLEDDFAALADLFHEAREPRDRIFLSVVALAANLGFRITEVLTMPADCLVENKGKLGLRYWPEKAGEPYVKWVPSPARIAVERAVRELQTLCADARNTAQFIESHPGQVPPGLEGQGDIINSQQLADALRLSDMNSAIAWARANGVASLPALTRTFRKTDLQAAIAKRRPQIVAEFDRQGFEDAVDIEDLVAVFGMASTAAVSNLLHDWRVQPLTKASRNARYSTSDVRRALLRRQHGEPVLKLASGHVQTLGQTLVVVFENQMRPGSRGNPFVPLPFSYSTLRFWLGEGSRDGSIFDRNQKTRADGSRIVIRSHKFRHWINTAAKNGGLSDVELARWAGRRDIKQNQAYVHGTVPAARDAMKAAIREGKIGGPIASMFSQLEPTSREEFLDAAIGAVFMMPWGACSHNFASRPCEKHMACLDGCGKLLRKKGDQQERAAISAFIDQQKASIEKCRQEGAGDDSPWIVQLARRIAGAEQALALDEDSSDVGELAPVFPGGRDLFQQSE